MIHFVGAGPGAPDLITLRGARLLAEAGLVVYAGSLVNPQLLEGTPPGCVVMDSARMTLEDVVEALQSAHDRGIDAVRLHTGDPALYGAIREQMDQLDARGIPYDVTPGVSSLFGAAAALGAELTLPGVTQSLIVTRAEGRTPVPEAERLVGLAAHGCTLALFLSAGLLDRVEADLAAAGLEPDTPAAIVYRATWPDQQVHRCTASTLARTARQAGITRTALVLVGRFLGEGFDRSLLYDPAFSHGYRTAHAASPCRKGPAEAARDE
ncbi:precorrin-4 C(11)-methyltransferase [Eggerthellaceae bacterium zg-1084]|uniref:precorrin-4 C(11)-methyltransferase n=1 Tax=Berryella wangjianweii TaxID=2734634 RepID=UPI001556F8D0|nr:precorrin-4 C(11)-methyltransferase [Berryella wangjianweii]NPD31331.1 precorrin-4 C(11)-methyltransferase [Berryella wangjianweii]